MTVKELKKGQFFTVKPIELPEENQVWIRVGYDRETKKYECVRFDDCCAFRYLAGGKQVYTDFVF